MRSSAGYTRVSYRCERLVNVNGSSILIVCDLFPCEQQGLFANKRTTQRSEHAKADERTGKQVTAPDLSAALLRHGWRHSSCRQRISTVSDQRDADEQHTKHKALQQWSGGAADKLRQKSGEEESGFGIEQGYPHTLTKYAGNRSR